MSESEKIANNDSKEKRECSERICQDLKKAYDENPEAALAMAVMMELWGDKDSLKFEIYDEKRRKVLEI